MDLNEELKFLWKFKKKIFFFWGGGGVGGSVEGVGLGGGGGQGGCERRIEVFVKIKKKNLGGVRWGGGGGSVAEGVRWGGGVGGAGVRVDVNEMLGVGVMWGMGDVNQE